jgi:hypothetical protein
MIKMGGKTQDGRKFVVLGLSEGNLKRLREKKPIIVHKEEIDCDTDIWICWGETEDALAKEFHTMIDERTRVQDRRGEKKQ